MATWTTNAVDPIGLPPNNEYPSSPDTSSRSQLLRDANPAGQGDLLGLFKTRPGTDTYYLLLSTDDGATWSYLAASGGSAPPHDGYFLQDQAICQDSVGYKVHWATVPQWATSVRYHRIALAYGADGHVSGWSWEAADQPGPALDTEAGAHQGKAEIQEVLDASGNHILLMVGIDQPSTTRIARLVAACTTAGANALAPTLSSHWVKLDGSAGVSVLCARNTDTGVDAAAMLNLTSVQNSTAVHNFDCCAAQLDNGDLAVFFGPMYFDDPDNSGDIRRWRFTRSGGTWALDAGANGAVVSAVSATSKPCMGNVVAHAGSAWFTYWTPTGLHVGSVNSSGTWTADAVTQPDTSHGAQSGYVWGWSAIGFAQDGTMCIQYERDDVFASPGSRWIEFSGTLTDSTWTLANDLALWQRSSGYTSGNSDGSTSWSPIRGAAGACVFAYPYADWSTGYPHFSIHTLQGEEEPGPEPVQDDHANVAPVFGPAGPRTGIHAGVEAPPNSSKWAASQTWTPGAFCTNGGFLFRTVAGGAGATSGRGPSPRYLTDGSCTWELFSGASTFTSSELTPSCDLGLVASAKDDTFGVAELVYAKLSGSTAITAGDWVAINRAGGAGTQATTTTRGPVGISMASHALDAATPRYGWILVRGIHVFGKAAATCAVNAPLYMQAAGTASTTASAGTGISGAVARVAAANGQAVFELYRPSMNGTVA